MNGLESDYLGKERRNVELLLDALKQAQAAYYSTLGEGIRVNGTKSDYLGKEVKDAELLLGALKQAQAAYYATLGGEIASSQPAAYGLLAEFHPEKFTQLVSKIIEDLPYGKPFTLQEVYEKIPYTGRSETIVRSRISTILIRMKNKNLLLRLKRGVFTKPVQTMNDSVHAALE